MVSLNRVLMIGNLTRDPELRYIPSGAAVASFTIAMNRVYKLPSGEKKEEVSFVRVVAWGRQAETCGEYLKKGSLIFVEGRLQSRSWETPDGQKRSTVEVSASNVQFIRTSGRSTGASAQDTTSPAAAGKEPLEEISLDLPEERSASGSGTSQSKSDVPF